MKMRLLKLIDRLVGVILTAYLPFAPVRPFPNPRRFLLIRPGGIGDAVLLTPSINAINETYPACTIDILAEKRNAVVFQLVPGIRKVYLYDTLSGLPSVLRNRYDVIIDTEQWHRLSAVVARLTKAPMLIGYATNYRQRLFNHPVPYSHDDYEVESFYRLLAPLQIVPTEQLQLPFLHITSDLNLRASVLLAQIGESPFVAIFPGASIPERRWGADKFRQLVVSLESLGISVVVVGGKEDEVDGLAIVKGTKGINLAGITTIAETAAVIARGALLITGDSGILHIGVGLGVATVSLFGPSNTKKWAPCGDNHLIINKNLPCSPCSKFGYTPKCNSQAKCMADITVNEVFAAVMTQLNNIGLTSGKKL